MNRQPVPTAVEIALRRTETLSAIGILLGSLENLISSDTFGDGGLMSWQVGRTRFKWTASKKADVLGKVLSPPGYQALIALRIAAAAVVLSSREEKASKAAASWLLLATNLLMQVRNSFGADGTDHMNTVVCATLAAGSLFPGDTRAKEACAKFIAGQSCLSYLAAGLSKLTSPYWRNGSAMSGIFRTHCYGDERLFKIFQQYPMLAKATGWLVIAGESTFPLVLFAPRKSAIGFLGSGVSFHLGNAMFMGLNRFLWAFGATYPSVAHCSRSLSQRQPALPGGGR